MALTTAAIRSLLLREGGEPIIALLTIEHDDLDAPIRLARNTTGDDIVSNGETFTAAPWDISWGADTENAPKVEITIVNVDRVAGQAIESITDPALCTVQLILESEPDEIIAEIANLELRNARWDAMVLTAELSHFSFAAEPWPFLRVTPQFFPALFR